MSRIKQADEQYIWHPFTQMKNATHIPIVKGEGVWLYDEDGKKYIDAVSSWWVSLHGHANKYIADKVHAQFMALEQVIFAGFTHAPAATLAERLLTYLPAQQKVFFSDNGSTAVEVGIKMALQYFYNRKENRQTIIALDGAYHGDTFGSMAVSQRGTFTQAFNNLFFSVIHVPAPLFGSEETAIQAMRQVLSASKPALFIYEPILQGSAGMRLLNPQELQTMLEMAKESGALLLADEVMTGFYRTGRMFASEYMNIKPDLVALSKGLTGGVMPMGITACTQEIFDAFLSDTQEKTFFHGHSFTANPLACAAALASLDLLEKAETKENIVHICRLQQEVCMRLSSFSSIRNVQACGTVLRLEVKAEDGYFSRVRDTLYNHFIHRGILLRPLGNVLYVMPPYCITESELTWIHDEIALFLQDFQG